MELVYIRIFGKYGETEPYEIAWNKLMSFPGENKAITDEIRFIGLSFDDLNVTKDNQCRFYACASVKKRLFQQESLVQFNCNVASMLFTL